LQDLCGIEIAEDRALTRSVSSGQSYWPRLTIEQILAWADAHHAATGRWPVQHTGPVRVAPFPITWLAINNALRLGMRGLPGGSTLRQLLLQERSVRPPLTVERILAWADAHHTATGRWPRKKCGIIVGTEGERWETINLCLILGRRGLPGGTTLARLLGEHRDAWKIPGDVSLSREQILAWADAHRIAQGRWPNCRSGAVLGAPGETWNVINSALFWGGRGLPGGSNLARLLIEHHGPDCLKKRPDLTIEQILAWADAHHAATGKWPLTDSGPVRDAPDEKWRAISQSLARGTRGLPGGSSLARLLAESRGKRNHKARPRLTVEQILMWADAHHAARGQWPTLRSGPVRDVPGESWSAINFVLVGGWRGLGTRTTLARFLAEHRPTPQQRLSHAQIRKWAEAHRAATGVWPNTNAGAVIDAPGQLWRAIDAALRHGRRGLPGGESLRTLFRRPRFSSARGKRRPALTVPQILAWVDAYHAQTGRWPQVASGPIDGAPGETWVNIYAALYHGRRGLPRGFSLSRLIAAHRSSVKAGSHETADCGREPEKTSVSASHGCGRHPSDAREAHSFGIA
jgi:hypothetical protein